MKNNFLDKLLEFYDLGYNDLVEENYQRLKDLPSKDIFKNGQKIASFLKEAILSNKKILIYGDYDCDGIMSTSIMMLTLTSENYKPGYYIPSREFDGYGLTKNNIDRFHDLGYQIIVCVDNGITLVDEIDYAKSLGMEVVILDHHTIQNKLPDTLFIMHPEVDNFGKFNISAGVVSFYFSLFYLKHFDEYLFSLATLSVLSDSMPLFSYNRTFVKEGIKVINKNKFPQIFKFFKKQINEISEEDLQMQVIPKINAVCRLLNDNKRFNVVKFFLSKSDEEISKLSSWLELINDKRKELVNNIDLNKIDNESNIVFYFNDENEGIGGLIANKLLEKYNKPIFVFSNNESDKTIYKGSVRSKKGYNVMDALTQNSTLLKAFGGHEFAGGFTILKSDVNKFKENLTKNSENIILSDEKKYIEISVNDLTLENYKVYRMFAPFGEGRAKPHFRINHLNISEIRNFIYNKHIIYRLNSEASILLFNYDPVILDASFIDIFGSFKLNEFNGLKSVQLIVEGYELIY